MVCLTCSNTTAYPLNIIQWGIIAWPVPDNTLHQQYNKYWYMLLAAKDLFWRVYLDHNHASILAVVLVKTGLNSSWVIFFFRMLTIRVFYFSRESIWTKCCIYKKSFEAIFSNQNTLDKETKSLSRMLIVKSCPTTMERVSHFVSRNIFILVIKKNRDVWGVWLFR